MAAILINQNQLHHFGDSTDIEMDSSKMIDKPFGTRQQPLQIRLAVPADIPALSHIIECAARGLNSVHYSSQQIDSILKYIYGVDSQLIADGTYYTVEINGEIAGCGGWSFRNTLYGGDQAKPADTDTRILPGKGPAKIRAFFVHPQYARRGIGSKIMQTCIEAASAAGYRELSLVATLTGQPLYAAFGFRAIEAMDVALPDGVIAPCILMRRMIMHII